MCYRARRCAAVPGNFWGVPAVDHLAFLKTVQPFDRLDEANLAEVARSVTVALYPKNSEIITQGSPSKGYLIVLESGLAEVTIAGDQGEERSVGIRRPKEFCGETTVLTGLDYPASVRAVEDTVGLLIPRKLSKTV